MNDDDIRIVTALFAEINNKLSKTSQETLLKIYKNLTIAEASAIYAVGPDEPKTMKQIAGFSTKGDASDDIFSISGSSSGKNREGRTFTTTITNPLIKKTNCKWLSSGTLELTPNGFAARTVDFGSGTCDDDATFTVNGQTISFKLQ